jgi:hypothetical protein
VPDVVITQLEQGLRRTWAPCALLDEVQAEQALWQEFCDHGASLNVALAEALWLHRGRTFQLFEVSIFA